MGRGGIIRRRYPPGAKKGAAVSVEYPVQLARAVRDLKGYTRPCSLPSNMMTETKSLGRPRAIRADR
jgi:hypothetical protein